MVNEKNMCRYEKWFSNVNDSWNNDKLNDGQKSFFRENNIDLQNVKVLNKEETAELRKKWYNSFLETPPEKFPPTFSVHKCKFCYKAGEFSGYDWHIFSFRLAPHKEVERDFLKYLNIKEDKLILTKEYCKYLAVELSANLVKNINFPDNDDFYVFPRDCSWTFVNTHESMCFFTQKAKMSSNKRVTES